MRLGAGVGVSVSVAGGGNGVRFAGRRRGRRERGTGGGATPSGRAANTASSADAVEPTDGSPTKSAASGALGAGTAWANNASSAAPSGISSSASSAGANGIAPAPSATSITTGDSAAAGPRGVTETHTTNAPTRNNAAPEKAIAVHTLRGLTIPTPAKVASPKGVGACTGGRARAMETVPGRLSPWRWGSPQAPQKRAWGGRGAPHAVQCMARMVAAIGGCVQGYDRIGPTNNARHIASPKSKVDQLKPPVRLETIPPRNEHPLGHAPDHDADSEGEPSNDGYGRHLGVPSRP